MTLKHINRAERFLGKKLQSLRIDNGSKFQHENFKKYCEENGVVHEFTNVHIPEQNEICERAN